MFSAYVADVSRSVTGLTHQYDRTIMETARDSRKSTVVVIARDKFGSEVDPFLDRFTLSTGRSNGRFQATMIVRY